MHFGPKFNVDILKIRYPLCYSWCVCVCARMHVCLREDSCLGHPNYVSQLCEYTTHQNLRWEFHHLTVHQMTLMLFL